MKNTERDNAVKAITLLEVAGDVVGDARHHYDGMGFAQSVNGIQTMLATLAFEIRDEAGIPHEEAVILRPAPKR